MAGKESDAAYTGLEACNHDDDAPEVMPGQPHLHRSPSDTRPEAYNSEPLIAHDSSGNRPFSPRGTKSAFTEDVRSSYMGPPGYDKSEGQEQERRQLPRRYCGMRRAVLVWVAIVAVVIIVIAAVLGGVLGTVLHRRSSPATSSSTNSSNTTTTASNQTLQALTQGGLAAMTLNGTYYSYYQDPSGRIIENQYTNGSWLVTNNQTAGNFVVATDAIQGSPLAATSYTNNGVTFRQVFYVDNDGEVRTTNTSTAASWPESFSILDGTSAGQAAPNALGLTACSSTSTTGSSDSLNGIRVYYGSSQGYIQEMGIDFDEPSAGTWYQWFQFDQSDQNGGVGCTFYETNVAVYVRNATTDSVSKWTYNYGNSAGWLNIASSPSDEPIATGSDIAACNDDAGTDYIFYQVPSDTITRALSYTAEMSDFKSITALSGDSKLATAYVSNSTSAGAMLLYQDTTNASSISYLQVSRTGAELAVDNVP